MKPDETLDDLVSKAKAAIKEAETFANENGLSFDLDIAWGMGGTFYPDLTKMSAQKRHEFKNEQWYPQEFLDGEEGGWFPSSASC